jgi:MFS family permease
VSTAKSTRLPAPFWRLWTANAVSNIGDGMLVAALPLLATRVTDSRISIGLISAFLGIPWLLFALPVGALLDRSDRRRVLISADLFRAALIGGLALVAAFADVHIWMLWVLAFGLGVGEVCFDSASQAILPAIVPSDGLARANGLRDAVEVAGNTFVGAPIGSVLFAVAVWLPFGIDAASFVVAVLLVSTLRGSFRPATVGLDVGWRRQIRTGVRWLWRHRLLRNLALALSITNFSFAACESTFVLFATEELGIGTRGFGLLVAIVGAGSIAAGLAGGWLVQRMGRRFAVLAASFSPVLTMVAIGLVPVTWWVVLMTTVQAAMITVWSIIAITLRQQMVPDHLFGRVNSVFRWFSWGALPLGALFGGVVAQVFGLRAPYFAGAALMLVAFVVVATHITERAIATAIAANARREPHPAAFDDTPDGIVRDPLDDVLDGFG